MSNIVFIHSNSSEVAAIMVQSFTIKMGCERVGTSGSDNGVTQMGQQHGILPQNTQQDGK